MSAVSMLYLSVSVVWFGVCPVTNHVYRIKILSELT